VANRAWVEAASLPVPQHPARGVYRLAPRDPRWANLSGFLPLRARKPTHRCRVRRMRSQYDAACASAVISLVTPRRWSRDHATWAAGARLRDASPATAPTVRMSPDRSRSLHRRISAGTAPVVPALERPRARPRMGRGARNIDIGQDNSQGPARKYFWLRGPSKCIRCVPCAAQHEAAHSAA